MSRKFVTTLSAVIALMLVMSVQATSSPGAVGTAAGFEDDDGNLAPNASGINFDWNSLATTTWGGTAPTRTSSKTASGWQFKGQEDWQASTSDSGFAGGTKQDDECASVITQKADNKADLKRIYLASKTVNSHTFLMLGWVRINQNTTSPSAHVAFEFNKNGASCGSGSDGLVHRVLGDMLVLYDFEGGSDAPTIRLSRWVTSGSCEISSHNAPCWGPSDMLSSGEAEALVNAAGPVTDGIAPSPPETLGTKEFGEAGIDLTAAGVFSTSACETFGSAFGVSRTSGNSGTAQMKDLVGPTPFLLTNCATVNVTKTGSDGGSQAGAVFTLYAGANTSGTVIGTCTVQANGTCTPSFVDLQPGTYTIDETTLPTGGGYNKAAGLPFTFTLTAGETRNLAFEDPAAPGTVNVAKIDDAGDPVAGAVFTLYSPQGISSGAPTGSATAYTCTTDAAGACSISNVTPGAYTIDETVPAGYGKDSTMPRNISVANGGTTTVNVTDPRLFKVVVIVCRQYDATLYPSAVTIDGSSAGSSLSAAQATTAGLSESALCGLTAGAKSGLKAAPDSSDPHDADIGIPNSQP